MSHKYHNILEELYTLEPNLKTREKELISLIERMLSVRPDVEINDDFRRELRSEVLKLAPKKIKKTSSPFTVQILLPLGLSLGFASLFGLWLYTPNHLKSVIPQNEIAFTPTIVHTGAGAFGTGLVAQGGATPVATPAGALSVQENGISTKRMATDMIMPYEPTWYRYVYTGALDTLESQMTVYRVGRTPMDSREMLSLLENIDLSGMNIISLQSLSDLKLTNLSLVEEKRYGYQVNIDFQNGGLSLYQNYLQWNCEGEKCNTPLTQDDIPSSEVMISEARDFLDRFGVDLTTYGTPYVQENSPMIAYARSTDTSIRPIMDLYTIVFPIRIENSDLYYEYGGQKGISLTYDVRSGRISSLSGLEKITYTASNYPTVSSEKTLRDMIRSGGRYIQDESQFGTGKVVDVALGNPTRGYSVMNFYDEKTQTSSEYLVPAYIFGVLKKPENWYGQNQVIIPLVEITN